MDQLMWAADVKVNGKKIRAEYTDEATFRCEDEDVTSAYNRAVLWNDTYSRPINQAIGSVLVEFDNAVSVAALLFQVLSGKGIEDFTLYGSRDRSNEHGCSTTREQVRVYYACAKKRSSQQLPGSCIVLAQKTPGHLELCVPSRHSRI